MFDLEQSITEWRKQMLAAGIKTPVPLDELENHLREEIERQMKSGLNEQNALEIAIHKIGETQHIKTEFKKIEMENWNRPWAWTAWILFVISFFLPGYADGRGWQCAGLSATAVSWPEFRQGNWMTIHLVSLTLANLLMIISPFLLSRFSQNLRFIKWWRVSSFLALALVCSFVVLLIANLDKIGVKLVKVGCYIWTVSFLLLFLSTLKFHNARRTRLQVNL